MEIFYSKFIRSRLIEKRDGLFLSERNMKGEKSRRYFHFKSISYERFLRARVIICTSELPEDITPTPSAGIALKNNPKHKQTSVPQTWSH